jgi:HEAT repeat protein
VVQTAEAIAALGDSRIYQRLWGKLISVYADDRMAGIRAMADLGTEQARAAIVTMLNDGVAEVRLTAAGQLGRLRDPEGESKVLDALSKGSSGSSGPQANESSAPRVLAALAVGEIGSKALVRHIPALLQDRSRSVQLAAAKAAFMQESRSVR